MKAFIPITLFALAGASSACTFAFRSTKRGDDDYACYFMADLSDDGNGLGGSPRLGTVKLDSCSSENVYMTMENDALGGKYEFCLEGSSDKQGKVDGRITVRREAGGVVNIKSETEGQELVEGVIRTYYRQGVECPGAHAPS